jgi:hypothetical protein
LSFPDTYIRERRLRAWMLEHGAQLEVLPGPPYFCVSDWLRTSQRGGAS